MINGARHDRCKVLTITTAQDGPDVESTFAAGSEIRCRVARVSTSETIDGSNVTPTNVQIRVHDSNTVTAADRINVTKKWGATVNETYAIVGEPLKRDDEIVLDCQLLTGNSAG